MNTQELIDRVKLRLDDEIAPRVFNDDDILVALSDAQNEFALRTLCIFDGEDSIAVTAGSPWVSFPVGTLWATAAWLDTGEQVSLVTQHELEFGYFDLGGVEANMRHSNWRIATGLPQFLVTDLGPTQVRLVPQPIASGTLFLERYRLPDASLALSPAVEPEIPAQYHSDLVIGALAYLFDVPDQEVYDKEMALLKRATWENRLVIAEQLLQTVVRIHARVIPPPIGASFIPPVSNTIGAGPNSNT